MYTLVKCTIKSTAVKYKHSNNLKYVSPIPLLKITHKLTLYY